MRIVNASSREIERSGWISLGSPILPSLLPPSVAAPRTFIRSGVDGPCSSPGRGIRSRLSLPARVSATSGCIERTARALDVCVATLSPAVAPPSASHCQGLCWSRANPFIRGCSSRAARGWPVNW